MAWTASWTKGLSFDEGLQLAVGYNIWLNDDLRIEGANGDLIKRWATLPYLVSRPKFVGPDDASWRAGAAYDLGHRFFFQLGNNPEALLMQARFMVAVLGAITGLLVFFASRELFGTRGGLVSLALFVFCPSMLAFGGVVSTDLSITLMLFGATWSLWRLLQEISWPRVALSLGLSAFLVLAKPSGLVILVIAAILLVVRLCANQGLVIRWGEARWAVASRARQAGIFAALALLHVTTAWTALWAHYDFRFAAMRDAADPALTLHDPVRYDRIPPVLQSALQFFERTHVLPEGFLRGIEALLGDDDRLPSFMKGEWTIGGRTLFFPYAIWAKTPPAVIILLVLAFAAWWSVRKFRPQTPALYAATPHLALIGTYLAVALTEDINIGHRHVLPIYPSLYVLAGAATLWWERRHRWPKIAVAALLAWGATESIVIRPHYLAYFGPQVGGPASGYKRLVDSSLDWGMNLPELKHWLTRHNPGDREPVFLAYFGTDSPAYHGIKCRRLPGFFDRRRFEHYTLAPGYYAISATLFQGVYTAAFGPWNREYERLYQSSLKSVSQLRRVGADPARRAALQKPSSRLKWASEIDLLDNLRFARLCAWLRHRGGPPRQIGHSILVWKLGEAELRAALFGPPVELASGTDTINIRRLRRLELGAQ